MQPYLLTDHNAYINDINFHRETIENCTFFLSFPLERGWARWGNGWIFCDESGRAAIAGGECRWRNKGHERDPWHRHVSMMLGNAEAISHMAYAVFQARDLHSCPSIFLRDPLCEEHPSNEIEIGSKGSSDLRRLSIRISSCQIIFSWYKLECKSAFRLGEWKVANLS